jgi:hypothetical protein
MRYSRQLIYLLIMLTVAIPLLLKYSITPARLKAAENMYNSVEKLSDKDGIAFLFLDFGPSTKAENEPQAEVILEHLFRKRIPVALAAQTPLGESFLIEIPQRIANRLNEEYKGINDDWRYGTDWVNLGYRPGKALFLQGLAKSKDIPQYLGKDSQGSKIETLPAFANVKTMLDVPFVGEITGLSGMFDMYIRFLQTDNYTPNLFHACTSITIPEAYIFLDSGQIKGLLEGLSGAAWYSQLLTNNNPKRAVDSALLANTSLGISQLLVLFFIFAGNIAYLFQMRKRNK